MLNRITTVQECDATDDDSSTEAGNINIYLRKFIEPFANLIIYDAQGKVMLRKKLPVSGSLFYEINTQSFARGNYFIKIQTDKGFKFVKKILKQ